MIEVKLISTSDLSRRRANPIQVMKMAAAFAGLGHRVDLVVPGWKRPTDSLPFSLRFGLTNYFRIVFAPQVSLFGKLGNVTFGLGVLGVSRRWPDDAVILTRSERAAAQLARARKNVLYESHAFAFSNDTVTRKFRRRVRRLMDMPNVRMITISRRLRDLWTETGIAAEKIFVAHDGVDVEAFRRIGAWPKSELRTGLDLPLGRPIVAYAGSLGADRGIGLIFEAAAVHERPLFLILGGSPEEIREGQARASKNVLFAGYVDNSAIPLYLAAADVLVMPYQKTTVTIDGCSPMKVFEYLASGRPIIAPRFASYFEVLNDFTGVWAYEPDDRAAFLNVVGEALALPEASRAFDRYERLSPYSWENRARGILDFHTRAFSK